jgi:hypothetical protein
MSRLEQSEASLMQHKKELAQIQLTLEKRQQEMFNKIDERDYLKERLKYVNECLQMSSDGGKEGKAKKGDLGGVDGAGLGQDPRDSLTKEDIFYRRTREYLLKVLKQKTQAASTEHEDDLRLTFGSKSSMAELYSKGNMVKINISLFTRKVTGIPKEISIIAAFTDTVSQLLEESCKYWKINSHEYVLTDDKYVTLPSDQTIGRMFVNENGAQVISLLLHYKYSMVFEVLKPQEESIQIASGNAQGGANSQGDAKLNKRLMVRKKAVAKMDNAPEKFFNKYPLAKEYIDIDKIERDQQKDMDDENSSTLHYQGPIVFYAISIIVIIQLVQLFNYDIERIYNLRLSLDSIFTVKKPELSTEQKPYYSQITGKAQFVEWVQATVKNVYKSKTTASTTLFAQKTVLLGEAALIKYDTKSTPCIGKSISGSKCIYTEYSDSTKLSEDLKDAGGNLYPWGKFKSQTELGVDYSVNGYLTSYEKGGYMLTLGSDKAFKEDVEARIAQINEFVSDNTLAINFILGGYILDDDYFFSINFLIERTPSGGFQPVITSYDIFRPTLSWNYPFNVVGDIITYILTIIQVSLNVRALILEWRRKPERFFAFLKKILFVLTILFFIVQIAYGFLNTAAQIRDSGTKLLSANEFTDARGAAWRFINCLRFKAFNAGIAILMMAVILNHKITQKFTITILNETIIKNIQYLILVIPIFIGMALVGSMVLGPYSNEFVAFDKAMISVMLFTIGRIEPGLITKYDSQMALIFVLIFFVLSIFLSFTIFIGFSLQTYFSVMSSKGYYTPSWDNSNFQYFPRFAFFFLPESYFNKKKTAKVEEKKEEKKRVEPSSFSQLAEKAK